MIKNLIITIVVFCAISSLIHAENFTFCPKGMFASESGNIVFEARKWSSDYMLKLPNEGYIRFSGPIFPGYKMARASKVNIDPANQTIIATQECKANGATVTKEFTLINGGILSKISYDSHGKEFKKAVKYRIFLPLETFAGKNCIYNGTKLNLPKEKSANYTLLSRKSTDEIRFQVSTNLEVGIKFVSGVKSYVIADCRYHNKPESHYHLYLEMAGNALEYFICLLKPGQSFPSIVAKAEKNNAAVTVKKNLLFSGSDFEIGPTGVHPFCFYSWHEAWTSPGIQPSFDSTEKYQGKYSIKITAEDYKKKLGRFNYNRIVFTPVKLNPGESYTFSAWMKSDIDGMKAVMSVSEPWCDTMSKFITVGKEWKRYAWTFKPDKFKLLNYRYPAIGINQRTTKGCLWVDNVQLEAGALGVYKSIPLEFGASIDQPYKLFNVNELSRAAINLYFRNNSDQNAEFKINYSITDYWDKIVAQGNVNCKVEAGKNFKHLVNIPSLPVGYYRVNFDGIDRNFHDEAIFGIYKEMDYKGLLPLDWPIGCDASEGNPIVRKLGFGWTRCWNFVFKHMCPEDGKFEFEKTDIIAKRCKDANLNLMPILGPSFARASYHKNGNFFVPEWGTARKGKSNQKGSLVEDVSFPKISAWKSYIKAVVSRYKNSIKVWEILNEPNCWLTPEEYAVYMKAAYEAAKEADPNCIIVGVCATSDWGGEPAPWTRRVLEIDGYRHLDVLSIHMYSNQAPETYKGKGSDGMLKYLKKIMRKFGRDIPIWHSEKSHNTTITGYSQNKLNYPGVYMREPGFRVPDFRHKTEYLIRETLIDSVVGKGPYFWFGALPNDIYIMSNSNSYGLHHTEYDRSPCPELIAANGLARMLEGRNKPQELIKLSDSIYCSLYQGEKGTMAAIWCSGGIEKVKLDNKISSFKLYNMFGAPVPETKILKLSGAPLYLTFDGSKASDIKRQLLKSEIQGNTLTLSGGLELDNSRLGIAAFLYNKSVKNLESIVNINDMPASWKILNKSKVIQCKPSKYSRVFFPVDLPKSSPTPVPVKITAGKQNSTISMLPYTSLNNLKAVLSNSNEAKAFAAKKITIDGELSDWSEAGLCGAVTAEKVKRDRDTWREALNLSIEMRFRYDAKYLYLAAKVYDDIVERNAPAERAWSSDCIEFFLGLDPTSKTEALKLKKVNKTGKYDYQFLFAPGMGSGTYPSATAWNCKLKNGDGIKVASKLFEYGYTLEAAIPWESLKKNFTAAGTTLIMTFQAKDSDVNGEPARRAIFWTGNESNWLHPQNWGELTLSSIN